MIRLTTTSLAALGILFVSAALTGCSGSRTGLQAQAAGTGAAIGVFNKLTKKAIYDLKGGEKVADVAYRSDLATFRRIVESECRAAPSWAEIEMTCDSDNIDKSPKYVLTTGDGSTLQITLQETGQARDEIVLRASMKTRYVDTGGYGTGSTKSSGPGVDIFSGVIRNIDFQVQQKGIKKIRGGFGERLMYSGSSAGRSRRIGAVSSGPSPQSNPVILEAQRELGRLGYDCGTSDGVMGARTRSCIQAFQQDKSLPVTGALDQETLVRIRE